MNVKLYSIPWICERENFAASSNTTRASFLRSSLIKEFSNSTKLFNPPDELSVQDVGTLGYAQNVTYAAVTVSSFTWYLFITAVRRTPNNIIKFDYRIDYFQTFFRFDNNTTLRGTRIRDTSREFATYSKYLPIAPAENKLQLIKPVSSNTDFAAILFFKCESAIRGFILRKDDGETSDFLMSYERAKDVINEFSFSVSYSRYLSGNTTPLYTEKIEFAKALILPAFLISTLPSDNIATIEFTRGTGAGASTFKNHCLVINNSTFVSEYIIQNSDYINGYDNGAYVIKYGTVNYNNILPLAQYNSTIKIKTSLAPDDLIITAEFADEITDITADFACKTIDSASAEYRQNRYLIDALSTAINFVANASNVFKKAGEKDFGGAVLQAAQTGLALASDVADIKDKLHAPVETRGSGDGYENLPITGGFAFFIFRPVNYLEIIDEIGIRGYQLNITSEIKANTLLVNKFYYIRYSDILITGNMPLEARERVQNIFLNGLYLRYAG